MGTVDDYLAELDPADRAVDRAHLRRSRARSCRMPSRARATGCRRSCYRGKPLISVMRAKKHIGVYPFSPDAVSAVADALEGSRRRASTRGRSASSRSDPLPDDVVRALVARAQGADRGLTPACRLSGGGRGSIPIAIITTAMTPSRMRHARGVDEPAAEVARAEREPEEPDDARDHRARGEHPALVAVRVGDRAEQEHRVEVHVRVEPREGEARQHAPAARRVRVATSAAAPPPAGGGRRASTGLGGRAPRRSAATRAARRAGRRRRGTPRPPTARRRRATAPRAARARRPRRRAR